MVWPSVQDYQNIITNNKIINTKVTADVINRAEEIYGPRVSILKGKMFQKIPQHVKNVPHVPLPSLLLYKTEQIGVDFMFVNVHVLLVTTSFNIKFRSIMNMQGHGSTEAENCLNANISAFTARKINIETIVGDNEFEAVCKALIPVHIEILGADEYEGHVERLICIVKERTRCNYQNMPYKKCPKLMVVSSLEANITWINVFPKKNGISKTPSPSAIVLRTPKMDVTHATLQTESYVYCNIKARSTNNMKTRSVTEITLRISNERGGRYFMSLKTGCQLNSYQWQELPIAETVIYSVEEMATGDEAPETIDG